MLITQLKGVTSWFFSCITNSTPLCPFQNWWAIFSDNQPQFLSILQFHLKLLVRYGQIPITIMKFFLLQLCQHLSCSGGILDGLASSPLTATLPPPCTSLSCLTLENSCYFCTELEKVFTWPLAYLPDAVAVADSWREVKKAELVENTNSRSRFLFHLVWRGHGKELPWGLGQWGSGQLATCGKKEGVLIVIYSYICIIYIKNQISISTSRWASPWAVESAEKAARASPKLGGVAGVFDGVPHGRPAPPGLCIGSYPVTQFAGQ